MLMSGLWILHAIMVLLFMQDLHTLCSNDSPAAEKKSSTPLIQETKEANNILRNATKAQPKGYGSIEGYDKVLS